MDVGYPDVEQARPCKVRNRKLKHSERFLKIGVLPQKVSKVNEHNRSHAALISTLLIGQLQAFEGAEHHLQVCIKLPDIGVGL